jgi:fatty-acid desaturase
VTIQNIDAHSPYRLTNVNWITAIFMGLFHVGAIAAFFFFSWTNVLVALVLHWMAVGFGISLGYHRLHTHRGYKTSKAFEYFLALCGTLRIHLVTAASGRTWAGSCLATRITATRP